MGAFPALRALVLNRCALSSWRDVVALECALPLVEELYLAQNANLADLDAVVAADATAGFVDKAGAVHPPHQLLEYPSFIESHFTSKVEWEKEVQEKWKGFIIRDK